MITWDFWQEDWLLYHNVIFDGITKSIIVSPGVNIIDVKTDIYSNWKEWISLRDNGKFLPAIRVTGGDPIAGTTEATGDVYFLINGWRVLVDHSCIINGVIYSEDFNSPFIQVMDTQIVTNKVSAIVQTVAPVISGNISISGAATKEEIRQEIDSNSSRLNEISNTVNSIPTAIENRDIILNTSITELTDKNTLGGFLINKITTIAKYIILIFK